MTRALVLAAVIVLVSAAPAAATPTGTYQTRDGAVSCAWSPRADYVACATRAMARRGAYVYIDSWSSAGFTVGEVIRGGRRVRSGGELKTQTGRVRAEQTEWLNALRLVAVAVEGAYARLIGMPGAEQPPPAVEVHLWRPADFTEINARLSRPPTRMEATA